MKARQVNPEMGSAAWPAWAKTAGKRGSRLLFSTQVGTVKRQAVLTNRTSPASSPCLHIYAKP
jgi:hypothetical protein